jgi:VCBS repeat-containing protein
MITAPNANIEYVAIEGDMYVLAHEAKTKRNETFQGAVMDEQFVIFPKMDNDEDIQADYDSYIDGIDDTYGETTIYFIPNQHIQVAKNKVQRILNEWKNQAKHIASFDEGVIYIAYKYTASGMWVFISDHTGNDTFDSASGEIFDDSLNINSVYGVTCNNTTCYITGTSEESSGPDFYNSMLRDKNPIVALMVAEGVVFEDVEEPDDDEDEDDE